MLGLYRDNGEEHGSYYVVYWGYIGIMKMEVEATLLCKLHAVCLSVFRTLGSFSAPEPRAVVC